MGRRHVQDQLHGAARRWGRSHIKDQLDEAARRCDEAMSRISCMKQHCDGGQNPVKDRLKRAAQIWGGAISRCAGKQEIVWKLLPWIISRFRLRRGGRRLGVGYLVGGGGWGAGIGGRVPGGMLDKLHRQCQAWLDPSALYTYCKLRVPATSSSPLHLNPLSLPPVIFHAPRPLSPST